MREKPVPKSQIIEIPSDGRATARKPLPATIFTLMSGEKLESAFLLTASDLSIKVGRHARNIPLQTHNPAGSDNLWKRIAFWHRLLLRLRLVY
jgi:hypothetical protein